MRISEQKNKKLTGLIKNLGNHHFDSRELDTDEKKVEAFDRIVRKINETVGESVWSLNDVDQALREVEDVHFRLREMGELTREQMERANERVSELFELFVEYFGVNHADR